MYHTFKYFSNFTTGYNWMQLYQTSNEDRIELRSNALSSSKT